MKILKKTFLVLIWFQFSIVNALSLKEDSLKNNFAITDPRNPHCACHQYQKLADDEFKKLKRNEIKLNTDQSKSNFSYSFTGNSNLNSNNKRKSKNVYSKAKKWNFFHPKNKKAPKRKRVKRLRKDNTTCFHF